ncbi:uncharacterized protein I303_101492 [Kwoniella dejecticola CBS 10117]|uniref:Uncharacterized protein n=1 Tax=Kwoniella dejecticola CBS 10117 TaxID=1296121 RepID=A0A1A6ADL4_9TREE|nr:uncharacterized protein I303_02375 [Kwoniella dejecticola CBS 10117]OBR88155.1 hypothetical protein I303_02375 [Kwoniella dejecticola CBS 10117]
MSSPTSHGQEQDQGMTPPSTSSDLSLRLKKGVPGLGATETEVPSNNTVQLASTHFMGPGFETFRDLPHTAPRGWFNRRTYDPRGGGPSEETWELAEELDKEYLVPILKKAANTPINYPDDVDYTKGSTWTSISKAYHGKAAGILERSLAEAYEAFSKRYPDQSRSISYKMAPQEEYAALHPDLSKEHHDVRNWERVQEDMTKPLDWDRHTRETDALYASGKVQSKGYIDAVFYLGKGAYATIHDADGTKITLDDAKKLMTVGSTEENSLSDRTFSVQIMSPETQFDLTLLSGIGGFSIDPENQRRSMSFIDTVRAKYDALPKNKSTTVQCTLEEIPGKVWGHLTGVYNERFDAVREMIDEVYSSDPNNADHFYVLEPSIEQYEAHPGKPKLAPHMTFEDYETWWRGSEGVGKIGSIAISENDADIDG